MSADFQTLTFSRSLPASLPAAYFALTTPTGLRNWLCDECQADPQIGGRIFLWWKSGYYASGVFTELERDRRVSFSWFGREEPGPTEVRISLESAPQGVQLTLEHLGVGAGDPWQETVGELERGWKIALDNLVSILETGYDLRLGRRPTLGIVSAKLDPLRAHRLGLPDSPGVLVEGVLPGLGGEQAGLRPGDLIVRLGDHKIEKPADLKATLSMHLAGDDVVLSAYRGLRELKFSIRLAGRPQPPIPATLEALVDLVADQQDEFYQRLVSMLAPVDEASAVHSPEKGRWSVREVVAHLVATERENHGWIAALAGDLVPVFAGDTGVWVQALVVTRPTMAALLDSLRDAQELTRAMLNSLPEEFLHERKAGYVELCSGIHQARFHADLHLQQIEALIAKSSLEG